jgi:copper(I)-binding protein
MTGLRTLALAGALAFAATLSAARAERLGDLEIDHPWSRATPAAAPVGAGYLTIVNKGTSADRLVSAGSDISNRVEIHEMAVIDGIMRMRGLDQGIEVPAGGKVEFKPGGYHIMFIGLKAPIARNSSFKGTLTFEKAGTVEVEYKVEAMGMAPAGHSGH